MFTNIHTHTRTTMTYNGWTNYETWNANLWFDNFDFTDYVEDGVFDEMTDNEIKHYVSAYIEECINDYVDERLVNTEPFIVDIVNS